MNKVKELAEKVGIDLKRIPIEEVRKGLSVETEHKDVIGGDEVKLAKMVKVHVEEDPHYYTNLEKMERCRKEKTKATVKDYRNKRKALR